MSRVASIPVTADGSGFEFEVGPDGAGSRLDVFLAASVEGLSRTRAQRAIDDGDVIVNGSLAKSGLKLRVGDRVDLELHEPPPTNLVAEDLPLEIIHEDADLVVLEKPAGMVVHPGAGVSSGTLANALAWRYGTAMGGEAWRPGIVHRLDRDTSGLMVVARTDAAHAHLSSQFQARSVTKRYLAMTYGRMIANEGRCEQPIGRHPQIRVRMAIAREGRGRPALTIYRVLERFDETTLLDVNIRTGRTHQIRVHLAAAGYAVLADETYAKSRSKGLRSAPLRSRVDALGRQFLHAAFLAFDHPRTGERLEFNSKLPELLAAFLEYCRAHAR